jgi:pimeloyl-ACP methyl ester carboxylesterase
MKTILFAALFGICFSVATAQDETKVAYGYNENAGKYFEVAEDTKLYYEIYGEGEPILMLHGGVYGYIDEFEFFIDSLSKNYQVVCLATRGHVKSDIGREPFTYDQRAKDAKKLMEHLNIEKTKVIGFSDGGYAAYQLAADYPKAVERMIVIGAGDRPEGSGVNYGYSEEKLIKEAGGYFKKRLAAMPEPKRWNESLQWLNALYENEVVSEKVFKKIECPVLLVAGDKDQYSNPETLLKAHKSIKESYLSIIPGCGHVVFYCNWNAVWAVVKPFLNN